MNKVCDEVDNIKHLVEKTPRTMIPTLKAGGLSFKGILEIITDRYKIIGNGYEIIIIIMMNTM